MLSVILTILKIIGIVLAVLVGLILLIVLLVGFVPIRYKAAAVFPYEGEMTEEEVSRRKREILKKKVMASGEERTYKETSELTVKLKADAVVSWLLHIVHVTFRMDTSSSILTVRLFGLFKIYSNDPETVKKKEEKRKKKEEKKRKKEEKKKNKKSEVGKENIKEENKEKTEAKEEIKEEVKEEKEVETEEKKEEKVEEKAEKVDTGNTGSTEEDKDSEEADEDTLEEKEDDELSEDDTEEKEKKEAGGKFEKLRNKYLELKKKKDFIMEAKDDPRVRSGISYAKKKLFLIIKRILPKKLKGRVAFGMDDPATTGYITGAVSLFYGLWGGHFILEPDFENKKLEADVDLKGRLILGLLVIPAVKVWFNKDIKYIRKKADEFKNL